MNQRHQIRKKVAQLRKEERKASSRIVNSMFTLVMGLLCCAVVVLSEKIYQANGFEPVMTGLKTLSESFSLTELKQWLFLEKWMNDETAAVSSSSYQWIEENYYETSHHEVRCIDDGIVIYVDHQDSGAVIMVHQDNGLIVSYGLLNEVYCKEDDRVLQGVLIGKVEEEVYLDFTLDGVSMSYEEAVTYQR